LAKNPLEAWTSDHFEQPIVMSGLPIGRVAVVNDPAAIRRVLLENRDNYQKDWLQRRVLSAGLTEGLLTAEDHQWRMQRRALAPLFSRKTVMNFSAAMVEVANGLVVRLAEREGETVDIAIEATRITLEVLERTIFSDGLGRAPEDIRLAMKKYFETIGRIDPFDMLGIPGFVPRPWRWRLAPMLRLFETAIDSIVSTRRERIAKNPAGAPRDILTLLLEATDPETGEALSETEIRANILTFIAAGHETTATALFWALYLLALDPANQDKVAAEVNALPKDAPLELDRLKFTRAVIEETMRLYPPVFLIARAAKAADTIAGFAVRPKDVILISPWLLHRHEKLWQNPNAFVPQRFLPPAAAPDRFAYLPFGVGARVCIGAHFAMVEATLALAKLIGAFEVELAETTPVIPIGVVTTQPDRSPVFVIKSRA